jgi:hypothetical protein
MLRAKKRADSHLFSLLSYLRPDATYFRDCVVGYFGSGLSRLGELTSFSIAPSAANPPASFIGQKQNDF